MRRPAWAGLVFALDFSRTPGTFIVPLVLINASIKPSRQCLRRWTL